MFHGYRGPNDNLPHMDATSFMELPLWNFPYATFQITMNPKSISVPVTVPKVIAGSPNETG